MSGSFALDIDRIVKKAKGDVDLVVRKVALDLFGRIIVKSPVDTGRFKSNWQVSVNAIPSSSLVFDEAQHKNKRGSKARGKTAGADALARVHSASVTFAGGQIIYLVNNLVYARALEYGHSKQAPSGMVRLTVQEYRGVVTAAVNEVKK